MDNKYVVYHTIYHGDLFPPNYIGSTTLKNIQCGYKGSVRSKIYKADWNKEIKNNPSLFEVFIISYHDTREDALYHELECQKIFNVITNNLFVNMSYASPKGFFGRDVKGHKNPMYNKKRTDIHWTQLDRHKDTLKQLKIDNSKRTSLNNKNNKYAVGHKVSDEMKKYYSNNNKQLKWYKNVITNECVFAKECPIGFIPGRIINKNKGE